MRAISMRQRHGAKPHRTRPREYDRYPFHAYGGVPFDPVEYHHAVTRAFMDIPKAAGQQTLGSAVPHRRAFLDVIEPDQCRRYRRQVGMAYLADQQQRLQKPAGKFEPRQQVADVGHAHTPKLAQKFNTVVIAKPRPAYQDNIAGITRINPLVDYWGNVINIVIMTEKKKSFHTQAFSSGVLRGDSISII